MGQEYIGQILLVGYNFAQRNFAKCDGQIMPISQNNSLFSLLGTIYGGDGRTTYGLPDLRGRVPIHQGHGPGLSDYRIGSASGAETVRLTVAEMPSHGHSPRLNAEKRAGNSDDPTDRMFGKSEGSFRDQAPADDILMNAAAVTEQNVGGDQAHYNMQPYLVMNYQIALFGLYPSRS
ncbi:phage tail protein [Pacificoceanicola onchidii]|uniref:phage tail protein n=1 Tax=Pacificoceanicola onchidii TaxID=2562685 RepID=UPI0010A68231|nr:tail fiber protein [Pacificoceanicola onchidii]